MKAERIVAVVLVFAFLLQQSAVSVVYAGSGVSQTNQSREQAARAEQFEITRRSFASGRKLLVEKGVPFEPEELLHDGWTGKLKATLARMPEMRDVRHETAPLKGAYLADTLYLPEKTTLAGDTIILANNLVFEGKHVLVKGAHDLHVFPTQPVVVLGTTLAEVLRRKPWLLNVKFGGPVTLPSFSLLRDAIQIERHDIIFDTSGPDPEPVKKPALNSGASLRPASWNGLQPAPAQDCSTGCDKSGSAGLTGTPGIFGSPGAAGITPPKAANGTCAHPNGFSGAFGKPGSGGTNGGNGGTGFPGGDAGVINASVKDGDLNRYSFIANGGPGGRGGAGGAGGQGGDGSSGGDGGDGVACGCTLGTGGDAGSGGEGGASGRGGDGGAGGPGGNGGAITVSLPAGSPGANTSSFGGMAGGGGEGGVGFTGGRGGLPGTPGAGASGCNSTANGGFIASPGLPGTGAGSGNSGPAGANGRNGTINVTFASPSSGGGGVSGDPCLGSADFTPGDGNQPLCSPIIVDTTGAGFHLTSADGGVRFDIRGDGHPLQIAWTAIGSGNAFLVLDRNHNGVIDNGTEMFGNFTAQPRSTQPNGFLALAEFDKPENGGNGDGVIDEKDAVYFQLRLWMDENHDGISQPGELHTLIAMGVRSLNLDYRDSRRTDEFGNRFRFRSRVADLKGADAGRSAYDVFLMTK